MPISLISDLAQIPQNEACVRYLVARVVAPAAPPRTARAPVHLSLVLDRSGSMGGDRIESARRAAISALHRLSSTDRFSVVFYDDYIDVVVPSTLATPEQRRLAEQLIRHVDARGSTDLSTGWLRGCEQVGQHLPDGGIGRVLLLTDGQANRGITDIAELERHAAALCTRGVTTSTFGIGADFNEALLRKVSTAGGGNFYFIERPEQIEDFMTSETGDALDVVARNVSLVLRVPEMVKARCRSLWPAEEREGALHVRLGNLLSEQELVVLFELHIPAGREVCPLLARLADADGVMADDAAQTDLVRVERVEVAADGEVVLMVAEAVASEARSRAMEAMQHGDRETARRCLLEAAERLSRYGAAAEEHVMRLQREVAGLQDMSALDRKRMYMSSQSVSRGRSSEGYAMKSRSNLVALFADPELLDLADLADRVSFELFRAPLHRNVSFARAGDMMDRAEEADCVAMHAAKFRHFRMRIVVVGARMYDNWFSHWHAPERTGIVSVAGVDPRFHRAFLAYETLLYGLHAWPQYDAVAMAHDETRGCLFDFCADRRDLEIKLQTMDICPACEPKLVAAGIPVPTVRHACTLIREAGLLVR